MTLTDLALDQPIDARTNREDAARPAAARDLQGTFTLMLALVWLLDAVLQMQPSMFTPGTKGLSGMLRSAAAGNPGWIAHMITWNASIVDHHPVLTNSAFALVQLLIGLGIVWQRTRKPALGLSIAWAVGVWWLGEGLGGVLSGAGTPFGGGPGAVLFYAVLAVLLWPREGSDRPFVAARALGVRGAKILWSVVWAILTLLCLLGLGRSPTALRALVATVARGEPGWLTHLDRFSASFLLHDGTAAAILLAIVCGAAAVSVYLPPICTQVTIVVVVVVFSVVWVAFQDVGGVLAGGATDPNSGPLVVLLALAYWPITHERRADRSTAERGCTRRIAEPSSVSSSRCLSSGRA
ncbi:MAG: hypothetical protein ACRDWE_05565 [Acidimicrobiales bacterium]